MKNKTIIIYFLITIIIFFFLFLLLNTISNKVIIKKTETGENCYLHKECDKDFNKFNNKRNTEFNRNEMTENLEIVKEIFDKYNIFFLLGEGTALGAIREGQIIENDTDVDLIMFKKDEQTFFEKCLPDLEKKGFWFARKCECNQSMSLARKNNYIDIDIYGKGQQCWGALNSNKNCSNLEKFLKPYGKKKINNKTYNVPNIKYIEELYGKEDWKTPSNFKGF